MARNQSQKKSVRPRDILSGSTGASEQNLERPLPHSAEAERVVLGSITFDNSLVQAVGLLRPDDCYVRAHRRVFLALIRLSERGSENISILLGEELRREGALAQEGIFTPGRGRRVEAA